jgi:integrase
MSDLTALDLKLIPINQRLKLAQLAVQIERRGNRLVLRSTLPPKPGSHHLKPRQQRLSLGIPANPTGLKQAEQEAKVLALKLMSNSFDWREYDHAIDGKRLSNLELSQQIDAFQQEFFSAIHRTQKPASTKTTWTTAYEPYLKKLLTTATENPNLSLPELLIKTIQSIDPKTRSRQIGIIAFVSFAKFMKLEIADELKEKYGTPSGLDRLKKTRELPTDEQILDHWHTIPNPQWKFVYGVMAAFGLRNHEVFFSDYTDLIKGENHIQVLSSTKTGRHEVWAFPPDWIDHLELRGSPTDHSSSPLSSSPLSSSPLSSSPLSSSPLLPDINTDLTQTTLQRVGQRVTAQFRRYRIPFSPYDLRHAWAVRTIHVGLPDTVAAKMMGHSVTVHTKTYHQWLTRRDQQAAVTAALSKQ